MAEREYTTRGQGNLNTVLGAVGTAAAVMPNLFNGGIFGNGCNNNCSENTVVTRYENSLVQQIAAKDSENALLRSNIYTDGKLVEIVKDYTTQINALERRIRENEKEQAMYNGANTAAMNCMSGQIAQLFALTKLVVPNSSVCPGWGNVNIAPATTPATA